jgi:hypothetical protein
MGPGEGTGNGEGHSRYFIRIPDFRKMFARVL